MKKCFYCAEEILEEAIKCKHCGEWLEQDEEVKEIEETGLKQCPTCGNRDIYRTDTEDGSRGDWCPHCNESINEVTIDTSKYENIEKILTETDDLLQQIDPEIIEQSQILKKLKLERGRLAATATQGEAEPDKEAALLLPESNQLTETREALREPGRDLIPVEQASVQPSMARTHRGTLILWGLVALLLVLAPLAGYQWQRAQLAEKRAQAAEKARDLTRRDLSVSYDSLGTVSLQLGDLKAAREYFKKYLTLSEQLAHQDPNSSQARRDLSISYDRLGDVGLQLGDLKAARKYFEKSLNLREQLAHQHPENAQARRDLSVSYDRLGDVSLQLGDLKAARDYFEKSLNLRELLAHQHPESTQARRDLAVSYARLGNVSLRGGDLKVAREYFEKYLNLSEQLALQDPENAQTRKDLASSYNCLGNVSLQGKDLKEARQYFEKSLTLIEQLAHQDPVNAQVRRDQAVSYNCLGKVSLQLGDLNAARDYFEKSLQLTELLAHQDPGNAQIALELGVNFCTLGQVYRAAKQYPEAKDRFRKGLDQLSRLKARGKLPPAIEEMLTTTQKELSVLPR